MKSGIRYIKRVLSPLEYAQRHGVTRQYITKLLQLGRIPAAYRETRGGYYAWRIPHNAKIKKSPVPRGRPRRSKITLGIAKVAGRASRLKKGCR